MSNPNTDGEDSPAGPNRDGDGRDGTGQASVGHEDAGRERTVHASTGHEGAARESTVHANIVHASTEHEGAGRESTVPDGTGHHSDRREGTGSRRGDLPEIEAPGLSAFAAHDPSGPPAPSAATNAAAGEESLAMDAVSEPDHEPDPMPTPLRPTGDAPARCDAAEPIAGCAVGGLGGWGAGAALVRALPPQQAESPPPPPLPQPPSPSLPPPAPSFGLRRIFAVTAAAAVIGGLAGSLTTAGFTAMVGSPSAGPSYDQVFADGLARIDHEVAVLKGAIDTSTRTQTQQVAKIADRMDRAEKAQNDAGTRIAKAGDVLDRVERRLAASGEVTGGLGEGRGSAPASASAASAAAEAKRPVVEGWVLRDVVHGAAMIQGHGGIIAVLPGESLPGLGRIEAVKRQDGRWVVVTARGLILPR
jgi:hypothetical protein